MQRMCVRRSIAMVGAILVGALVMGTTVSAELIRPRAGRAYPDIAADINGVQTYTFNPTTRTGTFQVLNTPYLIALGPTNQGGTQIQPNGDGTRRQEVNLTLDGNGRLIDTPENHYALYGTVVLGGQRFSGLLLKGKPTAFGARVLRTPTELAAAGVANPGRDVFDLSMKITGGALADQFGSELYMRIAPKNDTFDGQFNRDFSGRAARSNTRGYHAPRAVPEPSTLLLLLVCGLLLVLWRCRRWLATRRRPPRAPAWFSWRSTRREPMRDVI